MKEARDRENERRDASWAGKRGQAERAALAQMTSSVQGRNAADYAARRKITRHAPVIHLRFCLGQDRRETRQFVRMVW